MVAHSPPLSYPIATDPSRGRRGAPKHLLIGFRSLDTLVATLHGIPLAALWAGFALLFPIPSGADPRPEPVHGLAEPGVPPKNLRSSSGSRTAQPAAIPDIYGPGAVLTAGNVFMKVTNFGVIGNPYFALSSDPSGQWPGASGVEYLNAIVLAVGGINPEATDPAAKRRVSSGSEWRPATFDPEDRMYKTFEGDAGGRHTFNDDFDFDPFNGEPRIDEDVLDGRDNDGDGRIDEDHAAIGQMMFSCVIRDDTQAAILSAANETHVPLGLECRQRAWAYSVPGYLNFNVIEYTIYNRSGHSLDSVYIGFPADLDAGSVQASAGYYVDDQSLTFFPDGVFTRTRGPGEVGCRSEEVEITGFSVVDGDADGGMAPGVVSFLLFGHTTDALGIMAPTRTGFTTFRAYVSGTPFNSGGGPTTDQQRYQLMSHFENIDTTGCTIHGVPFYREICGGYPDTPHTGLQGDWVAWNAIGPYVHLPDGGSITATIGIAVEEGLYSDLVHYPEDYALYRAGGLSQADLFTRYPALENAFNAQVAYEGVYERPRLGTVNIVADCPGCETGLRLPRGATPLPLQENCGRLEEETKYVTENSYTWFNFDCNFCTGLAGFYLRHWEARTPPLSPNLNVSASYNYSDNPNRVVAGSDHRITLAWDNLSENRPDPKTREFDFRTYRVWKAADWHRPVGSAGPSDEDWSLIAEYRIFDHADSNFRHHPTTDTLVCPKVQVPNYDFPPGHERCADETAARYPDRIPLERGGCRDSATINVCLRRGDLWDRQSGKILRPDTTVDCARDAAGKCVLDTGLVVRFGRPPVVGVKTRYQIGRYRLEDEEVKNGFIYFYSITAGDSTGAGELFGRRSSIESDAVTPQAATRSGLGVWVVPNPYRGVTNIAQRSSSWDLFPSPADPTGSHIDFMGMPPGKWTLSIYTVAGDLVATIRSDDPVNTSTRRPVIGPDGVSRPGYNRQQDHEGDGQASWNLVSRNGQDVVSGIYLFVVDSDQGQQRGKFVIIR